MEGSKPDGAPLGRALPVADAGSGDESLLGNIYIGKVKNVVKNINAAFIDLGGGKTGYFSLAENPVPLYTDELNQLCSFEYSGNSEKKVSTRKLKLETSFSSRCPATP